MLANATALNGQPNIEFRNIHVDPGQQVALIEGYEFVHIDEVIGCNKLGNFQHIDAKSIAMKPDLLRIRLEDRFFHERERLMQLP
ncbi:MAG: hypothetical protein ACR2QF_18425 [Geminicoccaceae bacterium]